MNQYTTSRLSTTTKSFIFALLLSQTVTSSALDPQKKYGYICSAISGTVLAWIIAIAALRLETKNPVPELPTLKSNAGLLDTISYYFDIVVGQKRKNRLNEDGTVSKCPPRSLGVLYEYFKFLATGLAIFQTIDKAEASGINWLQNIGLYQLFCSECEGVS